MRVATKDYQVPDSNVIIKKGTTVFTSIYAIHHDAEYFPDPEKFDPERFSPSEIEKRNKLPFTPFLAFGEGWINIFNIKASIKIFFSFKGLVFVSA